MTENASAETPNPQTGTEKAAPSAAGTETPTLELLQKKNEELEAQVREKEGKYLYLYAEFENFKKRSVKERSDLIKFGWENVARELLEILDNFQRAVEHIPPTTDKNLTMGLNMIVKQFQGTLEKQGVQAVTTEGQAFDPNLHEAVAQEPSDTIELGKVVREHSRGYTLHGRLLRASRVTVSSGKPA